MKFNFKQIGLALILAFFTFQIGSLIISTLIASIPIFHGGAAIILMLFSVAIMSLFVLAINIEELKRKENLIFIILIFGLLVAIYYFLPKYVPSIFSISPVSEVIKKAVGEIFTGNISGGLS